MSPDLEGVLAGSFCTNITGIEQASYKGLSQCRVKQTRPMVWARLRVRALCMEVSMLELIGVTKRYGEQTVLDNISLSVENGQIVSILGPSGGGKTTLLNISWESLKSRLVRSSTTTRTSRAFPWKSAVSISCFRITLCFRI